MTTLTEFEDFTTPDIRKRVVDAVFGSWSSLSKEAQDSMKDAIGPIDGFRPGKSAPKGVLKTEAHKLARKFPDFFSEVIMPVWVETNPELRDMTASHVRRQPPPDAVGKKLDGYCAEVSEVLARQNGGYDKEDVMVMVRYCVTESDGALYEESDSDGEDSPRSSVTGSGMGQFLFWLSTLPPDAEEWDGLVPDFANDLLELIGEKKEERSAIAAFTSVLTDIKETHAEALEFFQADTSGWADSRVTWVKSRDGLRQQVDSLSQVLQQYAEARRSGSNLNEERRLREQRETLERAIESRINAVNDMIAEAEEPDWIEHRVSLRDFIETFDTIMAQEVAGESGANAEDDDGSNLESVESLVEEQVTLEERIASLEEEKKELEGDTRRLQREVTLWRSSYETERQGRDDSEPDPIPAEFTSVAHVLQVAEKRFADRLLFKFNSASDSSHPYDYPADVWNALEWLATTYYDSRTGANSVPNLDYSLREVSRFHYTPFQSDNTIGMYPDSYFARVDGHKIPLKEHIGAGVDRKPTNTIRIAFNWDKQSRRVIVGYIGLHQHNTKT